jgi:hypothetical protein
MHNGIRRRIEALEQLEAAPALPGIGQGRPIRFSLVGGKPVYTRTDAPGWDGAIVEASLDRLRAWADEVSSEKL